MKFEYVIHIWNAFFSKISIDSIPSALSQKTLDQIKKQQLKPRVCLKLISVCPSFTHRLITKAARGQSWAKKLRKTERGGSWTSQGKVSKGEIMLSNRPLTRSPWGIRALELKIITFLHSFHLHQSLSFDLLFLLLFPSFIFPPSLIFSLPRSFTLHF